MALQQRSNDRRVCLVWHGRPLGVAGRAPFGFKVAGTVCRDAVENGDFDDLYVGALSRLLFWSRGGVTCYFGVDLVFRAGYGLLLEQRRHVVRCVRVEPHLQRDRACPRHELDELCQDLGFDDAGVFDGRVELEDLIEVMPDCCCDGGRVVDEVWRVLDYIVSD